MGKRYSLTIIMSLLTFYSVWSINVDSLLNKIPKFNFFCVPTFSFQQDLGHVYGLSGGYYFRFIDSTKISNFSFSQTFTQKGQYQINFTPFLYLGGTGKWTLSGNLFAQKYPNSFRGTGNTQSRLLQLPLTYTSHNVSFYVQFQRFIDKHVSFGIQVAMRREKTFLADSLKNRAMNYQITGWKPYFLLGFGAALTLDSRDNLFYPKKGILSNFNLVHYNPIWGSTYNIVQFGMDFRQYIGLYKDHVFAWQLATDWRLGNAIPFQMLTTVGGNLLLRGIPQGIYRDNMMAAIQGEYRFPIYKILRGAAFLSTGDVFNSRDFMVNKLKVSYGAGVRFQITRGKIKVNGRWDVTRNNYDKGFQFFFTALEAF